jgi:glycosyltransferase involved in cell wall biosynthesis
MHILFLTDNFPPEVNAPASRTYEHCREWVKRGHRVTVITCAPNFPTGRLFPGHKNGLWSREAMGGIDVVRVWTVISANSGFLWRTIDYASFMLSAAPASLFVRDVDVIIATSPQLFTPMAAWLASRLKRRPYVFELRDLWPESIRAVGAMRNSYVLGWLERLELFLYRQSAHVVSVTESFRTNLVERGIPAGKVSVIKNGVDLSRFQPRPRDEQLAAELALTGKIVVGYVGTHGMAHGLGTLLNAAELLQKEPCDAEKVHFLFLGDGAEKEALKAEAARKALRNVTFVHSVSRGEVVRYWSLIDIAVIHLKKGPLFTMVIPSNMFECMAMGIPVLHGVAGESADIVEREGIGFIFEPENANALAVRVRELATDPARREELARRGIEAARRYDRTALARQMLDILRSVCEALPAASTLFSRNKLGKPG